MKKVKLISAMLFVLIFVSCSTMYIRPTIQPVLYRTDVPGSAEIIFKAALKILPMMGYEISGSDAGSGTIRTSAMEMTVDPSDCDCGTAMGVPVIKSGGVKAKVYFILQVSDGELAVRADIRPEFEDTVSALASAGTSFVCVSKGGLEKMLARKFVDNMKTNAIRMLFDR